MSISTDVRKRVTGTLPLYALAGAGDLVVGRLRAVPGRLADLSAAVGPQQVSTRVLGIPTKAQAVAITLTDVSLESYDDLVVRGRNVVRSVRRQKATKDLQEQAATTVRRTRAARVTATTSAEQTGRATKRAATSARKTGKAAAKAAGAGAAKIG